MKRYRKLIALAEALLLLLSALPLSVTAVPGPDLTEESEDELPHYGAGVPAVIPPEIAPTSNKQIEALISVACGEFGYAAQGGWTKYGQWFAPGLEYAAWCAMFVSWCAAQAGISTDIIAKQANVDTSFYAKNATVHYFFDPWLNSEIQLNLQQYGIRCTRTEYIPQRGDLIYIHWDTEGWYSTFCHIGIVCGVYNNRVYTVEGNSGTGVVRYKFYDLTDPQILAYATPNYLRENYETGYYSVLSASGLNLREAPSSSSAALKVIPNGAELRISEVDGNWGRTEYLGYEGWVSISYLRYVRPIRAEKIVLPPVITVEAGYEYDVPVEITPSDTSAEQLAFVSSDPEVFTAGKGKMKALTPGTAKLTVGIDGITAETTVLVVPAAEPLSPSPWLTVLPPAGPGTVRQTEDAVLWRVRTRFELGEDEPDPAENYVVETEYEYGPFGEERKTRDEIEETDTVRIVSRTDQYVYFHYHNLYNDGEMVDSIEYGECVGYDEITLPYEMEKSSLHDMGGQQAYKHTDRNYCAFPYFWFFKESYTETTYSVRERTEIPHRYYDTGWSEWTAGEAPDPASLPGHTVLETASFSRYTDNRPVSLTLTSLPAKTAYRAGEEIELAGIAAKATMADGTEIPVPAEEITADGYDPETEGEQTVTVRYGSASASFVITVTDPDPTRLSGGQASGLWNDTVRVPVTVSGSRGLKEGVFTLAFDPAALAVTDVKADKEGVTVTLDDGKLTLTLREPVTGDSPLFTVTVKLLRTAPIGDLEIGITAEEGTVKRGDGKTIRVVTAPMTLTVLKEDAHHETEEITAAPTCETEGVRTFTCTVCGAVRTEKIPALPHKEVETRTEPTCETDGSVTRTCETCGRTHTEVLPKVGHDEILTVTEPTCMAEGKKEWVCRFCGRTRTETLPKSGHHETSTETAPTCTEDGERVYSCTDCGTVRTEVLPKVGHDFKSTVVPPTGKDAGYTSHVCTRCGERYDDTPVPALGFEITFVLENGTVIDSRRLSYGDRITPPSSVPPREATAAFTYEFSGWDTDPAGMTVTEDRVFTAVYRETRRSYRIRFFDENELLRDETLPYGTAIVPPSDPSRPDDERCSYEFLGWNGLTAGMKVTGDADFTASYHVTVRIPDKLATETWQASGAVLRKIPLGTTVGALKAGLNAGAFVTVTDAVGNALDDGVTAGSGMRVLLTDGETVYDSLTVAVTGDLNGDGKITLTDYVKLKSVLFNGTSLPGGAAEAADLNGDGNLTLTDYVKLKSCILTGDAPVPN